MDAYEALAFVGSLAEYIGGQVEIKRLRRWIMPVVNIGSRRRRPLRDRMDDFLKRRFGFTRENNRAMEEE